MRAWIVCLATSCGWSAPNAVRFPTDLNIHRRCSGVPGLDAQRQTLAHGVRVSGATVHLVTSELDGGPIIVQAAVPVLADDTVDTLSARILQKSTGSTPKRFN
jgi:folate-dependent phosphoribosylglycinamide formyltransferase PurN